ncbi:MAG: N-6 DNA methylase [Candidatus Coatesbacteria bacterium]|nr:N-6 DNA methylase [Candidatus Coatesbacteria bacterium]
MADFSLRRKPVKRASRANNGRTREQGSVFSEDSLLPTSLPQPHELRPAQDLPAIFAECHNYIYANEGLLKEKVFHEVVKLLVTKLYDERHAAEDRLEFGITSSEYRRILANAPSSFEARMRRLFDAVRNRYPSFFSDDSLKLKPLTLAYIVGRLQHASLTQTPGDVKGEAFQAFVSRHQRGDRGEFFTPHPITRLAVEMIAPKPAERVVDPACGSGGFLIETASYVSRNNRNADKGRYVQDSIHGIEFNPDVALSGMIRLAFEGGTGAEIVCGNALLEYEGLDNAFDVVLTNPPFGSKGKVEDPRILESYSLARRWSARQGGGWAMTRDLLAGQSPEILFIERSLRLLRPGGRMGIVLPDGLLQNVSSSHIRFWIRSEAKVMGVVSIPQEAFVPYGTGIKTSLLLLQKLPSSAEKVLMARIERIGYDVKGQPIYKRDDQGRPLRTSAGLPAVHDDIDEIVSAHVAFTSNVFDTESERIFTIPEALLNTRLDVEHYQPRDRKLLHELRAKGAKPLGEIARICSETDDFRLAADGEIRYIAISDVDARTMQVVSQQVIKAHEAPSRATYRLRAGDIITATSGASTGTPRHATALITEDEDGAICSNGFAVLRDILGVEPLFLLAYMRTEHYLRQVRRLMTGHAIPAISMHDLSTVLVPIPPGEVQRDIGKTMGAVLSMRKETLKTAEKLIEKTQRAIDESCTSDS